MRPQPFLLLALAAILTLCAPTPAQIIHLGNYAGQTFEGWKELTTNTAPPMPAGKVTTTSRGQPIEVAWVAGSRFGIDGHRVHVRAHLESGEIVTVDLSDSKPWAFAIGPPPTNVEQFFGVPTLAGQRLSFVDAWTDGAAYVARFRTRTRIARMLHAEAWTRWYPDTPAVAYGEIVVTASNPAVPDMTATVPARFDLRFGQADCIVPGLPWNAPLLPAGETLGDGQARAFPFTLVWQKHLTERLTWSSAGAAAALGISAIGIDRLWPDGNPALPHDVKPIEWTREHFGYELARLHDWRASRVGPAPRSMDTGSQADQGFDGAECMQGWPSLGAEMVRYLAALGQFRRPCHHLNLDGTQLSLDLPELTLWISRAHWHKGQSPDQRGKPRGITEHDTHGWMGPDDEHWLCNNLLLAARLTGSRALQCQARANAINWLYSETLSPSKTTSGPRAARAMGYAGCFATLFFVNAEDRELANLVRDRWIDRVEQVYVPVLKDAPNSIWQWTADGRLVAETNRPLNTQPYQLAFGAWGVDYGCRHLGPAVGRELARDAAQSVLENAYSQASSGRWLAWDHTAYDPQTGALGPLVQGAGAHRTGWFDETWFLPGIAVVLRHEPDNEKARAIWRQNAKRGGQWVPPGVPVTRTRMDR